MNQDTICAIATAQGGAIGSIRVSGPHAIDITERIFIPVKAEKKLTGRKPYTLTFGHIYNGEEIIDECLSVCFVLPILIQEKTVLKLPAMVPAISSSRYCSCLSKTVVVWRNPVNLHKELS